MEFNPQSYTPDGIAMFGNDAQLLVKFFNHPQLSKFKSDEAGMPVYDDVEMVEVFQPGEKESVKQLATDFHKRRFSKQYENFKKGIEQTAHGTPLDLLFPSEPGMILTLKSFNIFTVQQLAALNDTAISSLPMGGRQLVERAKVFLSTAQTGASLHEMDVMRQQIADLQAALQTKNENATEPAADAPERRRPGRPPNPPKEIAT